ncbi:hypothetical protein [Marinitenerispora sediminis]|uniref:hypothetical protein n=1 Tax=Marinitenerispora sediminis TaxID=1931232 RepID=UPI001314D5EE|nr:hypothetical protein [Marinitenerispora sediminis]
MTRPLWCPTCGQRTFHTEITVRPVLDCTGQVLAVFGTFECRRCQRRQRVRVSGR